MLLTPAQIKSKSFESRRNSFLFLFVCFLFTGVDAPHVYVRAWALGCFHSLISTRTFRRALTASAVNCAEIEFPFSGVTSSGRIWRKVTESDGGTNSKHRFTTSFLQPLPYLVTPQGPENCQLMSSFLVVLRQ